MAVAIASGCIPYGIHKVIHQYDIITRIIWQMQRKDLLIINARYTVFSLSVIHRHFQVLCLIVEIQNLKAMGVLKYVGHSVFSRLS